MVDPENLAKWQTTKTFVTPLTDGPPRRGYRVWEGNRVGPRRWEQVVEFVEYEPGRVFAVRVVDGPPSSGRWVFERDGEGANVRFEAEFWALPLLATVLKPLMRRQFRAYHRRLRDQVDPER